MRVFALDPVIPKKAGIQKGGHRWGRGGMVARLCPRPVIPAKAGIQKGGGRLRLFVRIRIGGIGGIFRISLCPACAFAITRAC